jgi:hypothetical protein
MRSAAYRAGGRYVVENESVTVIATMADVPVQWFLSR